MRVLEDERIVLGHFSHFDEADAGRLMRAMKEELAIAFSKERKVEDKENVSSRLLLGRISNAGVELLEL
jgi:hypothetical protein